MGQFIRKGWRCRDFASLAILAAYGYALMEWLFFVTKPSFMDVLTNPEQIRLLFVAALPVALLALALTILGLVTDWLLSRLAVPVFRFRMAAIGTAAVLSVTCMLLLDNFTWTLFKAGIASTQNYSALVYLGGLVLLFVMLVRKISVSSAVSGGLKWFVQLAAVAFLLTSTGFVANTLSTGAAFTHQTPTADTRELPNILFFAADGVDADHLTAYGYERETTPFLDSLLEETLVAAAAYTNASRTTGSTISLLTGRYPATTKVLYPPHILLGEDSFWHLPAILKGLGYRQIQESIRYYADAHDLNMQQAFDEANGREISNPFESVPSPVLLGFAPDLHYLKVLWERTEERLMHLSGARTMARVFEAVSESAAVYGESDANRIDRAIVFMTNSKRPFFAHIHLLEAHCCRPFKPRIRQYSAGHAQQTRENRVDYYDDVILDADRELRRLVDALRESGKWENTVLVYSSDHNIEWDVKRRVPLIFRFPGGAFKGIVEENTELLDVAPTVLEYIGVSKPAFMEGTSLLSNQPGPMDPVFAIGTMDRTHFRRNMDQLARLIGEGPPLYGLLSMVTIVCQSTYELNLETGRVRTGVVANHPAPCDQEFPSAETVRAMMATHLEQRGFELPTPPTPPPK